MGAAAPRRCPAGADPSYPVGYRLRPHFPPITTSAAALLSPHLKDWSVSEVLLRAPLAPQIPYFNAPIFLENKTQIGKVDEILGQINCVVSGAGRHMSAVVWCGGADVMWWCRATRSDRDVGPAAHCVHYLGLAEPLDQVAAASSSLTSILGTDAELLAMTLPPWGSTSP